jgi:hypothetical protein
MTGRIVCQGPWNENFNIVYKRGDVEQQFPFKLSQQRLNGGTGRNGGAAVTRG